MTPAEIIGLAGAAAAIAAVILTLLLTTGRLGKMAGTLETGLSNQNRIIGELKDEVVTLRKVVTDIAVFNNRLDNQGSQIGALVQTIEDLRHGRGFIVPFERLGAQR